MKNGFLNSKLFLAIMLILFILSITYLSTEEKYEVKEITKEIKLISNDK